MKILHFYKTYFPNTMGGVEKVIDQIAIGTADLGIESEVLVLTPEKKQSTIEMNGYKVHRVPQLFEIASTPFSARVFRRFSQLAKKADVIHYHFPWPFADLVHFATQAKKPSLVTYHSDIVQQKKLLKLYQPLMNRFLSSVDCIVATSPNYAASSLVLSKYADKVKIVPIGLDEKSYPKPTFQRLEYWRHRYNGKFLLFIGVMRYYKGLHTLIEAAKGINVPILIVGSGGMIEQELQEQVNQQGSTNVQFMGPLPEEDKIALLMLCYGVILPSHLRSEAFGVSLLEGAMFGKPMISCEIGTGTTFINIHQETGLVVPPENSFALRQAMQYLLDNPDRAAIMGENASKRYEEHFTVEKMAKSYLNIYEQLVP